MQHLVVLFILVMLGAFATNMPAQAQPLAENLLPRFVPLVQPGKAHISCVPVRGAKVGVLAKGLYAPKARVTGLLWDLRYGKYVIEISGAVRLVKEINRCAARLDIFYLWRRIAKDDSISKEPVFVFPHPRRNSTVQKFLKEV